MSKPVGIKASELITMQKEFVIDMTEKINKIKLEIRDLILKYFPDIRPLVLELLEGIILKEIMDCSATEWAKFNGF